MKKRVIKTKIGSKLLTFEADPNSENDKRFASEIEEVAKTNPPTMQDFFIRIAELQRSKTPRQIGEDTGKGSRLK